MDTCEGVLVLGEELPVDGEEPGVPDICLAVDGSTGAEDAREAVVTGVVVGKAEVCGKAEALDGSEDYTPLAGEHVGQVEGGVELVVADCVTHGAGALLVGLVGVVLGTAVDGVDVRLAVLIELTYIQRIYGSDGVYEVEQVAGGTPGAAAVDGLRLAVGEAHGSDELDPVLGLILGVDTAGVALVVGVVDDTAVLQVTCTCIVVEPAGGAAGGNVVFLAIAGVEHLVVPVVGEIVVLTVAVAELCVGVQAEVGTDELFAFGKGEHLVTDTTVVAVVEGRVCHCIGFSLGMAGIVVFVVQFLVPGFVVLSGVGNDVVVGDEAVVAAEPCIELDACLAYITLLSGDEDDTVCTAVTIDGRCGCVLQD